MNTPQRAPRPSWERMEATLREWHEDSLTDPEFMWLSVTFEEMADHVKSAIKGADQPHYLDVPAFGRVYAELDALTIWRAAA